MPCYDPREHEDRRTLQKRLDNATKAACDMSKVFHEYPKLLFDVSKETVLWILEHDQLDEAHRDP